MKLLLTLSLFWRGGYDRKLRIFGDVERGESKLSVGSVM